MMGLGFTSPWSPATYTTRKPFGTGRCATRPTMTLISHEKLDVLSKSDDGEVAKYKLELEIPATVSKVKRRESIQAVKKNANFKGFRKGTVPPFVIQEIESFVLHDSCNVVIEDAAKELELQTVEGEDALAELDIKDLQQRFRIGEDFVFTCEIPLRSIISEKPTEELEDVVTYAGDAGDVPTVDITKLPAVE
ncbi:Trigger factor ribosome-binding protein [Gracilaria domingensis]|nr:Trigger factor ribosome-binding protein [Gracilaria domingensis]